MPAHPFWFVLTLSCVLWYGVLIIYVGWKGFREIRHMIAELKTLHKKCQ